MKCNCQDRAYFLIYKENTSTHVSVRKKNDVPTTLINKTG